MPSVKDAQKFFFIASWKQMFLKYSIWASTSKEPLGTPKYSCTSESLWHDVIQVRPTFVLPYITCTYAAISLQELRDGLLTANVQCSAVQWPPARWNKALPQEHDTALVSGSMGENCRQCSVPAALTLWAGLSCPAPDSFSWEILSTPTDEEYSVLLVAVCSCNLWEAAVAIPWIPFPCFKTFPWSSPCSAMCSRAGLHI